MKTRLFIALNFICLASAALSADEPPPYKEDTNCLLYTDENGTPVYPVLPCYVDSLPAPTYALLPNPQLAEVQFAHIIAAIVQATPIQTPPRLEPQRQAPPARETGIIECAACCSLM